MGGEKWEGMGGGEKKKIFTFPRSPVVCGWTYIAGSHFRTRTIMNHNHQVIDTQGLASLFSFLTRASARLI
jgi:hypothetical protein